MKKEILQTKPFNLNDEQLQWVEQTLQSMSLEEKIGQLFFPIGFTTKEKELQDTIVKFHPGGMMYRTNKAQKVIRAHRVLQSNSKIPMFLAANLEAGGNGIIDEGTYFGDNMLIGATNNPKMAYRLGEVASSEGKMVGLNMSFAPVVDINMNFRNPVTNTRSFGDKAELVSLMSTEYVKAIQENEMAVTIKHFPGDGVDGRDHHLVKTVNSLPYPKWKQTFGKVYQDCIDVGALGLMVGHITLPDYFTHNQLDTSLQHVPASLNPVLLNELLRKELKYNGLTMTDATLMTGFGAEGKRKDLVPRAIAAGCDMFLFNRNLEEDFQSMLDGYHNKVLTDERLEEALTRILGLKAKLNLYNKTTEELVPNVVDEKLLLQHKMWSKEVADQAITLVKDDQNILPLSPTKHKRVGIMYFGNPSMMETVFGKMPGLKGFVLKLLMKLMNKSKTHPEMLIDALNKHGFYAFQYEFGDIFSIMKEGKKTMKEWTSQFDVIVILSKMEHESNRTSLQVEYEAMGFDAPWFVKEVPTILISTSNPYQQYDFEMVETVINAYSPKEDVYEAIVEKLVGKSKFVGKTPVSLDFDQYN
jgi:beta-N-acetylhexosaminidase